MKTLSFRRCAALVSSLSLPLVALLASACGDFGDVSGAPLDGGPPGGPGGPPTTGGKWEGHETTDACGRTSIEYRIVDEVCAGTDAADYLDHFRAPIMRDGARIGDRLYAVDATHLWVLDVSTPSTPVRKALLTGFGQPLSVASHGQRLLVAAGGEGLVIADVTDPDAPTRVQTIETDGPALDVFVDGDRAYVAAGAGGLLVVQLGGATASVVGRIPFDGFAAAIAVKGGVAYVAACDDLVTVDAASGAELGRTWVEGAYDADGILQAPAKDVFVGDAGVFVAAGRYGAVRVDVTDATSPSVVGNCTLADDVTFYASGVRAAGDSLMIAGGEWGILPIDLADPASCTERITPDPIPAAPGSPTEDAADGETCSTEPPWETLPWQDTWLPPAQAGQDPLQTLSDGEVLYAFGDATRIGMRAVDVRLPASPDLEKVGRYEEPRVTTAIAAQGSRLLVLGRWGGVFERDGGASLSLEASSPIDARDATCGAFLDDGRWVLGLAEPRRIVAEGGQPLLLGGASETMWPGTLSAVGSRVILADALGAVVADVDTGVANALFSGRTAELPAAVVGRGADVFLAAPEWTESVRLDAVGAVDVLAPHEIFGAQQAASINEWRAGLPRRLLAAADAGVLELATLGRRAGVALHEDGGGTSPLELPPGEYVGLSVAGDRAYAVSLDRGTYRSQLVSISLAGGVPSVIAVESWTGMAAGVASTGGGVFVADRDVGVRIYDAVDDGVTLAGVVDLAEVAR